MKTVIRVYSSSGTTFIFIVMINSASTSFLTHIDAPMHGKLAYRGGRAHLKALSGFDLRPWQCTLLTVHMDKNRFV